MRAGETRVVGVALLPVCDAIGCKNLADWLCTEGEPMQLCAFHGGTEPAEGWEWIGE